jgi:hypothetical protein
MKARYWEIRGVKIYLKSPYDKHTWGFGVMCTPGILAITFRRTTVDFFWDVSNKP